MKTALVTGGCGFIGFELAKKLIEKGYDVDIIDNLSIGYEAKNPKVIGANFLGGDVRAMGNIKDKPHDFIFHLAALSRIQPSFALVQARCKSKANTIHAPAKMVVKVRCSFGII